MSLLKCWTPFTPLARWTMIITLFLDIEGIHETLNSNTCYHLCVYVVNRYSYIAIHLCTPLYGLVTLGRSYTFIYTKASPFSFSATRLLEKDEEKME